MKAVLLNSGGIDSRLVGAIMKARNWELHSLHILFNPYNREVARIAAKTTADMYCVSHKEIPFDVDFVKGKIALPFTGLFVYTVGGIYASYLAVDYVFTGLRSDAMRVNWLPHLQEVFRCSKVNEAIIFESPLFGVTSPDEIIDRANRMGVPIDDTYSCTFYPPCGECQKCQSRIRGGL